MICKKSKTAYVLPAPRLSKGSPWTKVISVHTANALIISRILEKINGGCIFFSGAKMLHFSMIFLKALSFKVYCNYFLYIIMHTMTYRYLVCCLLSMSSLKQWRERFGKCRTLWSAYDNCPKYKIQAVEFSLILPIAGPGVLSK